MLEDSTSPHHRGTCTTPWGTRPPVDGWALQDGECVMEVYCSGYVSEAQGLQKRVQVLGGRGCMVHTL